MPKSPEKSHGAATEKTPGKAGDKVSPKGATKDREPENTEKKLGKGKPVPVNTGNTRVNLAFPFSKIEVQEPSSELIELATLLSELVGALSGWVPEETLGAIRKRADALLARVST